MKKLLFFIFVLMVRVFAFAQCADFGCNSNSGLYSNSNAADIEYDNIVSGFHATCIRQPDGLWKVWGEHMGNFGVNFESPTYINSITYPLLTGTVYKVGIGGSQQMVILTSTGLFVVGSPGYAVDVSFTSNQSIFKKIAVGGKADGLPSNVSPEDVKMLFVASRTIIITTCSGHVYVLSSYEKPSVYGSGGVGSSVTWSQVKTDANTVLSDVIVARGNPVVGYALKADGTLWTWGYYTSLGNGSLPQIRNYATQMTLPAGLPGVKMIASTNYSGGDVNSYYILGTDKKVYSLGDNNDGQLGDQTTVDRTTWVNAKNPDGSTITDAAWIDADEHVETSTALAVLRQNGILLTAGENDKYMIGRTVTGAPNFLDIPNGISATDVITQVEIGGHSTAVIKQGSPRYGYVGHRIGGSMGDGTNDQEIQQSFDFITPPIVYICGALCDPPLLTVQTPICSGGNASFTISGTPGDQVTYKANNGNEQIAVIGVNGSVVISLANVTVNQHIELTYILGVGGNCSNPLSISGGINVQPLSNPTFEPIPPVCRGDQFTLPTVSIEGITGSWQPAENNRETTVYTFSPDATCGIQATMEVSVYEAFDYGIKKICNGNQLLLQVIDADGFDLETAACNWQYQGRQIATSNPFNVTAFQNADVQATVPLTFSVTVTNSDGCLREHSIVVDHTYCDIQRGISPNGDGANDFFDLQLMQVAGLKIFNRYGVLVYSKKKYANQWEGQSDDGKQLPDGVYYYTIDLESDTPKTGWIYLNQEK